MLCKPIVRNKFIHQSEIILILKYNAFGQIQIENNESHVHKNVKDLDKFENESHDGFWC